MDRGFRIGRFEIDTPLGSGGMATVWRVRHLETGTPAALKALHLRRSHDVQSAFALEVRAMARLRHPHVVHIYDHGVLRKGPLEGAPYLVSELCSGGDLRTQRDRFTSWPALRDLVLQLLEGLGHAHGAGVLHRDLKMGNILFATSYDARPGVKLADFGIASVAGETAVDFGTPEYTGPEIHRGVGIGPPLDLYALGVLVWRLTTGAFPFAGPMVELRKVEERCAPWAPKFPVPAELEDWLRCLLRADPAERFGTAKDCKLGLPMGPAVPPVRSDPGARTHTEFLPPPAHTPIPPMPENRDPALPAPAMSQTGISLLGLRHVPLLGRNAELEALWSKALEAQQTGLPATVAVVGPRGAGHSALAAGFIARISEQSGALVLTESPTGRPGREVLEALLAAALGLDEDRKWRAASKALERRGIADPAVHAGLDQLASGNTRFLPATVAMTVSALSRHQPVVVWLDGARGPMMQRFIEEAPRFLRGPILVGISGTDSAPAFWERVPLEPLPSSTLAVALQHLAPVELVDALSIAEQSGGWPAAAVRHLRTRFRRAPPTAVAPDFDEEDWRIVRAAVALGGRVPREHLATVADVNPDGVVFLEDALVRDGLATVHKGHWLLDPALERAVDVDPDAYTHAARWALALADDIDADPLARVRCLLRAGRVEEAAQLTLSLRRRIHRLHGQLAELTVVRECLEALQGIALQDALHGALWVREVQILGDREGTIDLGLSRARTAARNSWMDTAAKCLFAAAYLQPMPIKRDLLDQALAHAPYGSTTRGKVLHSLAFQGARFGEKDWRTHAEEALTILSATQTSNGRLHELSLRRFLAREDGDFALAASLGRAVVGLARTDDVSSLDIHLTNLADCHIRQGELDLADTALQEASSLAELTGEPARVAVVLVNRMVVSGKRRDWAAVEHHRIRLESQELIPHIAGVVNAYALLAKLGLEDLEGARDRLHAVRDHVESPHEHEADLKDALVMATGLAANLDSDLERELERLASLE